MKKLLLIALLIVNSLVARGYIAIIDFEGIGVGEDDSKYNLEGGYVMLLGHVSLIKI